MLRLTATKAGARTVLSETFRTVPFHIGMPSYRAGVGLPSGAEVIVQGVGPGIFPDDALDVSLTADAGADLTVRGQGATKVYPAPDGHAGATARTMLTVATGGRLIYLPGALIPFQKAVYRQETVVEVAEGGSVALSEILTPGRIAMGERDRYTRLEIRLRASVAGRLVLVERGVLEPDRRALDTPGRHGTFACAGSLYLFGGGWRTPDADTGIGPVRWGAGGGEGFVVVRLFGPTAQAVRRTMESLLGGCGVSLPPGAAARAERYSLSEARRGRTL